MNLIDFTKNGGFRFKQFTLRKMQEAYFHILKVFIEFCNIPDIGNYIVSGCKVVGPNITAGYMYINGDLCRFEETAGDLTSLIKKNVVTEDLSFKNGVNEPVFRYTTAIIDPTGTALNAFTKVFPVFDANYVHTDNNYTNADIAKLLGIEPNAQVNVRTDWDELNPLSDKYLENRPNILPVLKIGDTYLGNFPNPPSGSTATTTITFPDVGTDEYYALAFLKSLSSIGAAGQDVMPVVTSSYTSTSFKIIAKEFDTDTKNVECFYILIKK